MFNKRLISSASAMCLLFAASAVLANTDVKKTNKPLPKPSEHHVQNKQSLATSKKPSKKSTAKDVSKTANKNVQLAHPAIPPEIAPHLHDQAATKAKIAPVNNNSYKKMFGFGPDSRIQINGFMSAGVSYADTKNGAKYNIYDHGAVSNNWAFAPNSLAGLQVTGHIVPGLDAVMQIVADGSNINGDQSYHPQVDWAFLRYKLNNNWTFRAGRMRIPAFLYSQTQQVGYTYPWVFLPVEVYRILPFSDFNGVDVIFRHNLGKSDWVVTLHPFVGENTSKFDLYTNVQTQAQAAAMKSPFIIPGGTTATFHENSLYGIEASVGNKILTVRGSYLHTTLTADIPVTCTMGGVMGCMSPGQVVTITPPGVDKKGAYFYSGGVKLNYHNFIAAGEYAHRSTPDSIASLTGYYGMVGYRIGKVLPYFSYGRLKTTDLNKISGPGSELAQAQQSYTLGVDYYFNSYVVAKVGVSRIEPLDGTYGLFTADPGRSNVMLYSGSVDVIF